MKVQNQDKRRDSPDASLNAASEPTPIHSTDDNTLQTPEEDRRDKNNDPYKNDRIDVSNDDLHETKADRMAGSDRAGTAERKDNRVENED